MPKAQDSRMLILIVQPYGQRKIGVTDDLKE